MNQPAYQSKRKRLLKSGQILNLSVPFTKYEDESGDGTFTEPS